MSRAATAAAAADVLVHGERAIPRDDPRSFELLARVASSPTGAVYCARRRADGALVALKTRLVPELGRAADMLHEARVNVAHAAVVRVLGGFFGPLPAAAADGARVALEAARAGPRSAFHMVLEWADGGDALSAVRSSPYTV